jgi:transcriptional regulator with XRE-family HTH domain
MDKKIYQKEVGDRIKQIRAALQFQQKEFAMRMKLSGPSLSEIENGKYKPGYEFLYNAVNISEVRSFIDSFERSPFVQYSILAHFRTLMLRDREIIEQDIARAEADRATLKPKNDG